MKTLQKLLTLKSVFHIVFLALSKIIFHIKIAKTQKKKKKRTTGSFQSLFCCHVSGATKYQDFDRHTRVFIAAYDI